MWQFSSSAFITFKAVSYTHLDVYKRQVKDRLAEQDDTVTKFYCLNHGILFIKTSINQENWKIIIPTNIEKDIIMDYHLRYGHMRALKVIKACLLYTSRCV